MTNGIKENLTYGSAIGMLIFGVILTTAGFIIDPQGQIHDSVLYVLGQCLLFAGSVMGVSAYTAGRMRHIEHEIDHRFRAYERGTADGKRPRRVSEESEEEPITEEEDEIDKELHA